MPYASNDRFLHTLWKMFQVFGFVVAAVALITSTAEAVQSVWAYPGYTGRMIYRPDTSGDRISDYSIVGYKQGKVAIPTTVSTQVTITDDGVSDDTARIQAALNTVAAMPMGADGYRGAVLIKSGSYDISGQLVISASGVVLRGEGRDDTGTILHARGTSQRELIMVTGSGSRSVTGTTYNLIDKTVPSGTNSFRVDSTAGLNVGDPIYLTRPSPANWIHDIGMDQLLNDGTNDYRWTAGSKNINWERTITRIEGNRVFIDTPVTNSLESKYGGGTFRKFTYSGRIENVGIENLRGESDYASDTDEAHSWDFVTFNKAQNVWVRGTKARYFAYSLVTFGRDAKWGTSIDNISELPKSVITGGRRYTYNIEGQQNLVTNSQATDGRHDFVLSSLVAGPNVFYNSSASSTHADSGPHHRWSTGTLFDNINMNGGEINIQNRWNSGTGHGWSGANDVIWNSTAGGYTVQEIITIDNTTHAKNWIIGSIGSIRSPDFSVPAGVVFPPIPQANDARYSPKYADSLGTKVATTSLYQAQLADAASGSDFNWVGGSGRWADGLKWDKLIVPLARTIQMRDYLIGDIDSLTYDATADDDYYIDPAFRTAVQSQFGSNIGGFDVLTAGRNTTFTQQFALSAGEQIVNASLALGIRPTSSPTANDKILIDGMGAGPFTLDSLGWTRSSGTTSVGMFDFGPYLSALQNGKLSVALNGNTAADFGLLALQVGIDDPLGANVTLSGGGTVTVDAAVPLVKSLTINGTGTVLQIAGGGQLTVNGVTSQGFIIVDGGIITVNGIMDDNSRVYISGGTFKAGNSKALGSTNAVGTTIYSGTLDVNGQNLQTEPITVQGSGVANAGAIINTGARQIYALNKVTLSGDVTFGGSTIAGGTEPGRWDIRGTGAILSTSGNAFNLIKVGSNAVGIISTTVDSALGNININQGVLSFETSTTSMGDTSKTVTIASGATLKFYNTVAAMNKKAVLNGGEIQALSGTGTNNTFAGPITVNSAGGILTAGGLLSDGTTPGNGTLTLTGPITGVGGVTKNGQNTVFITGTPGYDGSTTINDGILQINTGSPVALHAVTGAGILSIGNTTQLTADSINIATLTIGAGSTLTIAPIAGGPLAGMDSLHAVPEPSIWAMLVLAAMGVGIYLRRGW